MQTEDKCNEVVTTSLKGSGSSGEECVVLEMVDLSRTRRIYLERQLLSQTPRRSRRYCVEFVRCYCYHRGRSRY